MKQYPVSLFMFDALYVDGKDLTREPYPARRKALEKAIKKEGKAKRRRKETRISRSKNA